MTQEKKSCPSLGATITTGVVGGALMGYLAGSGIEDIMHEISVNPSIEYMKTIISGIGAIGWSVLGTLQYFNRDEHEGSLVMHVIEGQKTEKPQVKPKPNLEGLAHAFENVTEGIHNRNLANHLYSRVTRDLKRSPLSNTKSFYEIKRDSSLINLFEVFVPFNYDKRIICPETTLDKFFELGESLYRMAIEGMSDSAEKFVGGEAVSKNSLPNGFRELLSQEISLAQDIALWVTYLSKRRGIVGSKVREKLSQMGIEDPNYLSQDIQVLGQRILNLYDAI